MSRDPCLKHFLAYDSGDPVSSNVVAGFGLGNSCWIDSLFVALFHTYKESIRDFINNLQKKIYVGKNLTTRKEKNIRNGREEFPEKTIDMPKEHREKLEKLEEEIIEYIKYIYIVINSNDYEYEKMYVGYNLRIKLERHRNILITNDIIQNQSVGSYEDFTGLNNPFQLLQYLQEHILNVTCFNNFQLLTILPSQYDNLNDYLEKKIYFNDINLINIIYRSREQENISFFNNEKHSQIKEKFTTFTPYGLEEELFLHSIIILVGLHYTCYYKCKDNWYLYNDMLPIPQRTQIIGNFSKVKEHYNKNFNPGTDAEIMFLYLKTLFQHQRQLKLDQEDNIIDVISTYADYTKKYNNYIDEDDEDKIDRFNRQRDLDENKQRYKSDKLFAKKKSRGSRQEYVPRSQQVSQQVSQKLQPRLQAAAATVATDQKQNKFKLDSGEQIDIAKQSDLLAIYEKEKTNRARQQAATRVRELPAKFKLDSGEEIDEADQRARLAIYEKEKTNRARQQAATRVRELPAKFKLDSGEEIDEADQKARLAMYEHRAQRQSTTRDRFQEAAKTKQERREQERREQERREQEISDEQLARKLVTEIEEEEKARERDRQLAKDEQYAEQLQQQEYYNQYGRGIRIINDKCNTTIKNINNSNCNQKIQKIQKIQNVRDELIEDMNRFFNKKINKLRI
jgi:hypothetical protein